MSGAIMGKGSEDGPFTGEGLCNAWCMAYKTDGGDPTFHEWSGESRQARTAWESIASIVNFQICAAQPSVGSAFGHSEARELALELTKAELARAGRTPANAEDLVAFYLAAFYKLLKGR